MMEQLLSAAHGSPSGTGTTGLSPSEREQLKNAINFLEAFRSVRPTMPLQHAHTFLLVASEEGLGVQDYAERAGTAQSVMTRHLLDLGQLTRTREPGLGLLQQRPDPMDLRKHQTFLTNTGKALLHKVLRTMR